ncbi:MAG: TetR/AcrR family transcriptional regulator [Bacillota bacterium]
MSNPSSIAEPSTGPPRDIVTGIDLQQQELRQRILAVAKHKFSRFGYDGTPLVDVAENSGVSMAELLEQFGSKLGLLQAVFDAAWATINPRIADIVIGSASARDATYSIMSLMMHILEKDEDLARLMLFESRRPNPETGEILLPAGYLELLRICHEVIARGQKDGSFSVILHPLVIMSTLIGAAEGLLRDRMIAEQEGHSMPYTESQLIVAFGKLVSFLKP